jgi:hypothetical protein
MFVEIVRAEPMILTSAPITNDDAAAAPNIPTEDEGCHPDLISPDVMGNPMRWAVSTPRANAVRSSRPLQATVSATANAAGKITEVE